MTQRKVLKEDGLIPANEPEAGKETKIAAHGEKGISQEHSESPATFSRVLILCLEEKKTKKQNNNNKKHCSVNRTESSNNPGSSVMAVVP